MNTAGSAVAANPDVARRLGEKITVLMFARNMSGTDLARRVGCCPALVSFWRSGKRQMTVPALLAVAKALAVTPAELLEGVVIEP